VPRPENAVPRVLVGTDIVAVARLQRLLTEQPGLGAEVFTARELAYCQGRRRTGEHLAGRFAAKESVLKALGTGLGPRMRWTDVEVTNDVHGRPRVALHGAVAAKAVERRVRHVDVSLSHVEGLAVASAALVCEAGEEPAIRRDEERGT
jgi:holo-[acyl-carrier protein] synthase